MWENS